MNILLTFFPFLVGLDYLVFCAGGKELSVPFGPGRISVKEYASEGKTTNAKTFYATPLVRLIPDSAEVVSNLLTGKTEMNFKILMWSNEAHEIVHQHLVESFNTSIKAHQVEPLPMRKIRLIWKDQNSPIDSSYKLRDYWRSYADLPAIASFQFDCENSEKSNLLKNAMQTKPEMFYALEMEYLLETASLKEVTVTGSHVASTPLFSRLNLMSKDASNNLFGSDTVYLTEKSVQELAKQAVDVALKNDYILTGDDLALKNALVKIIKASPAMSETFDSKQWDKLYWDEMRSPRPDKLAKFLNDVLKKANATERFSVDADKINASQEYLYYAQKTGIRNGNKTAKEVAKALIFNNTKRAIQYNVNNFQAKPLQVFTISLSLVRRHDGILVRKKLPMRKSDSVRRIKVGVQSGNYTAQLTPELVNARLQADFNTKLEAFKETVENKLLETNRTLNMTMEARSGLVKGDVNKLKAEVQKLHAADKTMQGWFRAMGNAFQNWPDYCRLSGHYCNLESYSYASVPQARTVPECMRACDSSPRLTDKKYAAPISQRVDSPILSRSIDKSLVARTPALHNFWCHLMSFYYQTNIAVRCRLFHYQCPWSFIKGHATTDIYVKLSHIPAITSQMWHQAFTRKTLIGIVPNDPCHLIGNGFTYTQVPKHM